MRMTDRTTPAKSVWVGVGVWVAGSEAAKCGSVPRAGATEKHSAVVHSVGWGPALGPIGCCSATANKRLSSECHQPE